MSRQLLPELVEEYTRLDEAVVVAKRRRREWLERHLPKLARYPLGTEMVDRDGVYVGTVVGYKPAPGAGLDVVYSIDTGYDHTDTFETRGLRSREEHAARQRARADLTPI